MTNMSCCHNIRADKVREEQFSDASGGNGTDDDAEMQHHTERHEDDVEQEHGETQRLIHPPFTRHQGDDDAEEQQKHGDRGTGEPAAADGHWSGSTEKRGQEPRERQPAGSEERWMEDTAQGRRKYRTT